MYFVQKLNKALIPEKNLQIAFGLTKSMFGFFSPKAIYNFFWGISALLSFCTRYIDMHTHIQCTLLGGPDSHTYH